MSQKLNGILCAFLAFVSACAQADTARFTANTSSAAPSATQSGEFPSSPGAMLKKYNESLLLNKDVEWFVKYMKAADSRDSTKRKGEPPLSEEKIRNMFALFTGGKGTKPAVKSFEISRETINGNKSTVSMLVNRVDNTSDTVEFVLTKIDGMWIIGDFPVR
jgi:hypothetical protein